MGTMNLVGSSATLAIWDVEQDGGDGAAIHRAVPDAGQHDDGAGGGQKVGDGQEEGDGGGGAEAGEDADDDAEGDAGEADQEVDGLEGDGETEGDVRKRVHRPCSPRWAMGA